MPHMRLCVPSLRPPLLASSPAGRPTDFPAILLGGGVALPGSSPLMVRTASTSSTGAPPCASPCATRPRQYLELLDDGAVCTTRATHDGEVARMAEIPRSRIVQRLGCA